MPIPGHSMVSERVKMRPRKAATSFAHLRLDVNLDGETKLRTKGSILPPPQQRPGFLCEDISNGIENVHSVPLSFKQHRLHIATADIYCKLLSTSGAHDDFLRMCICL